MTHRAGYVSFVGRPNAGKSTLLNAIVGTKLAIMSSKPQTTRHLVRGIVTRPDAQLVIVDTPGLHRPRTALGQRLNEQVRATWTDVDVVAVCLPANEKIGPGDAFLVGELAKLSRRPALVALATKADLVPSKRMAEHLLAIQAMEEVHSIEWAEIIPVSALTGAQVDIVTDELIGLLPEHPAYYPDGEVTDESDETRIAELIREAALEDVHDELPHSIMVTVDEMKLRADRPKDKPLLDIFATIVVERDSQKGIIIGYQGSRLKQIGHDARVQIREVVGMPVFLSLHVAVLKDWQRDPKHLRRLGF